MCSNDSTTPPSDHPAVVVWKLAVRIVLGVVGVILVLAGVVMIVTPGPAVLLIPAGLAILASQFPVVRKWLRMARYKLRGPIGRIRERLGWKRIGEVEKAKK